MKCCVKAAPAGGFTLVEMLVSMVLLSMIMVGMVSVMRSMGQSQDRVDLQLDTADDIRVSTAFLRATLGRVSARRSPRVTQLGESPFEFSARPQELIWVGIMPARFGMGGRSYFRLALEPEGDSSALVLRFVPWSGQGPPEWNSAHAHKVASEVTSFAMSYEDARQPIPQWVDAWQRPDSLPARVRITLSTQAGTWPLWIVSMRQSPASQIGGSRFTAGGD